MSSAFSKGKFPVGERIPIRRMGAEGHSRRSFPSLSYSSDLKRHGQSLQLERWQKREIWGSGVKENHSHMKRGGNAKVSKEPSLVSMVTEKVPPPQAFCFLLPFASSSEHIRYSSRLPLVTGLPSEENSWFPQSVRLGQQVAGFGPFLCCTKEPAASDERSYLEAKK